MVSTEQRLAGEGAAVLVTDIQVDAGETTVEGIEDVGGTAAPLQHDVTSSPNRTLRVSGQSTNWASYRRQSFRGTRLRFGTTTVDGSTWQRRGSAEEGSSCLATVIP